MYKCSLICHTIGMVKKKQVSETALESLKNQLRERPELFERLSEIIELVDGSVVRFLLKVLMILKSN